MVRRSEEEEVARSRDDDAPETYVYAGISAHADTSPNARKKALEDPRLCSAYPDPCNCPCFWSKVGLSERVYGRLVGIFLLPQLTDAATVKILGTAGR